MTFATDTKREDEIALKSGVLGWSRTDTILLLLLAVISCLYTVRTMHWDGVPVEDAAMLLRYSEHLAEGHGITWNVGEHPVDGATDFLFMAAIAGMSRMTGLDVVTASRVLILAAHLLSVLMLYAGPRRLFGCGRALPFAMALYLLAGPAIGMASACFGAPFFAGAALGAWWFATAYIEREPDWANAAGFSLLALVMGLVRPEGVLFAGFMLLAIMYGVGLQRSGRVVICFVAVFGLLGGAYFAWHWQYFGWPLPNPFYRKGGHIYLGSLRVSLVNLSVLLAPIVPLIPLGFLTRKGARRSIEMLIPLLLFAVMWVLLTNENNHFKRFQYPVVPLVLFALPGMLQGLGAALGLPGWEALSVRRKALVTVACCLAVIVSMAYIGRQFPYRTAGPGMKQFAERLQPYAAKGYTIALTEAGQLPLYSQWKIIDALGLNDAYVAHHNVTVTSEYLDQYKPEIIMVHADDGGTSPAQFYASIFGDTLGVEDPVRNFATLARYARSHGYILAAAYGANPCNMHMYYVRPDFADSAALVSLIRNHPYYHLDNGLLAHDFRDDLPPPLPCTVAR